MKIFIIGLIAFLALFIVGGIIVSLIDLDVNQTEVTKTIAPSDLQTTPSAPTTGQ